MTSGLPQGRIVIAHRGACGYLPEHTLAGYAVAHAMGADLLELDVMLTRDNALLCMHDLFLESTTNAETVYPDRTRVDARRYAADFTTDELARLRVHERFEPRFPNNGLPFAPVYLEDAIGIISGMNHTRGRKMGLLIEIKDTDVHAAEGRCVEGALLNRLRELGFPREDMPVILQCFEWAGLRNLHEKLGCEFPLVQLIWTTPKYDHLLTPEGLDGVASYARGVAIARERLFATPGLAEAIHDHGLALYVYTFRRELFDERFTSVTDEMEAFLREYAADGLITDYPDLAVQVRDRFCGHETAATR